MIELSFILYADLTSITSGLRKNNELYPNPPSYPLLFALKIQPLHDQNASNTSHSALALKLSAFDLYITKILRITTLC
jgi:hypothetical protein